MTEKAPISDKFVLVPRGVPEGQDPSTRKVEVWHLTGEKEHGKKWAQEQGEGRQIQEVHAQRKRRPFEKPDMINVHDSKLLDPSTTSAEGQFALARELAGQPLMGDKVLVNLDGKFIEGVVEKYDTVDGVTNAIFKYGNGQREFLPKEFFTPEAQANLREEAAYIGEEVLEVVDVDNPEVGSEMPEAAVAQKLEEGPSIEDRFDALSAHDRTQLQSYVIFDKMLMKTPEDEMIIKNKTLNWERMSQDARDIAEEYSRYKNSRYLPDYGSYNDDPDSEDTDVTDLSG